MNERPEINDEYRYYLLTKRRSEDLIVSAFRGFRTEGIEPILIKGWAAARNYPELTPRFFADVDLAVGAADFEKAARLINAASEIKGVDLHRELRHLDTVAWDRLFENSQLVDLHGEAIRILGAEDHLRVLCVHWLTNGGEDRERLWDIVYAVRNRPAGFDWSKCLDVVSSTRRKWIISTIGIAHKYLGLELDGLPFEDEARTLPLWLTECLEKEWATGSLMLGLETQLRHPRGLIEQLRKRLPPNPIQATVDCEGEFNDRSRLPYQVRDMAMRLMPSLRRISTVIVKRDL